MDASARAKTFFDTNVLVYAYDFRDPAKQQRAATLLRENAGNIVISTQVLGEFYWTVTRKLRSPLTPGDARTAVDSLSRTMVMPLDKETVWEAVNLGISETIAYWDALIVKAASVAGCARLFTEDLNHGQVIDGVRIENPFL